jgi:hypothetical protein
LILREKIVLTSVSQDTSTLLFFGKVATSLLLQNTMSRKQATTNEHTRKECAQKIGIRTTARNVAVIAFASMVDCGHGERIASQVAYNSAHRSLVAWHHLGTFAENFTPMQVHQRLKRGVVDQTRSVQCLWCV